MMSEVQVWTEADRMQLRKFFPSILSSGCNIISDRQHGKSNLAKILVAELAQQKDIPCRLKVFDTASVWRWSFLNSFMFQEILDDTSKVYDSEENILYDLAFTDSERIMQFVGNTILLDYERNRERKKACSGKLNDWIIYILEEAQNSLGRYALNRNSGKVWLKMVSEGANFGLGFIFIGQRASDVSTQVIERQQSLFVGRCTGDNNSRKLRRLIGSTSGKDQLGEPIYEIAKTLKKGEFIFWNGAEAYRFNCPLFESVYPNQKPVEVKPPRSRWEKLF